MKDLVIAVYRKDCYAGETTLHLVEVLMPKAELPKQYQTDDYVLKAMRLVDFFI